MNFKFWKSLKDDIVLACTLSACLFLIILTGNFLNHQEFVYNLIFLPLFPDPHKGGDGCFSHSPSLSSFLVNSNQSVTEIEDIRHTHLSVGRTGKVRARFNLWLLLRWFHPLRLHSSTIYGEQEVLLHRVISNIKWDILFFLYFQKPFYFILAYTQLTRLWQFQVTAMGFNHTYTWIHSPNGKFFVKCSHDCLAHSKYSVNYSRYCFYIVPTYWCPIRDTVLIATLKAYS